MIVIKRILIFSCVFVFISAISFTVPQKTRTIRKQDVQSIELKILNPTGFKSIPGNLNTITIKPNEYLVAKLGDKATIQRLADDKQRHVLPFQLYGISASGTDLNLEVVVEDEGGLHFNQGNNRFEGTLHIGVVESNKPDSPKQTLSTAIDMLIINEQGGIDPDGNLSVNHTNLPFEKVTAHALAPKEPFNIRIRSSFTDTQSNITLDVIRPTIKISPSRPSIKGFGLETVDITVVVEGFTNPEGKAVILETTKGGLESSRVLLDKNGTGITSIRSIGLGKAQITASMTNADSAQTTITFIKPWMFLLFAIIGGFVGAVAKFLKEKDGGFIKAIGRTLLGIFIGIIFAAAFTVGVNLLGIALKAKVGEAVIFVLAALGGWAGNIVLPKKK